MSSNEKRYRFQIQFDTYADTDKEAVEKVKDMMYNMQGSEYYEINNPMIIWMAENYFASFENREIDFQQIESDIFDEEMKQKDEPLAF